MPLAAGLVGIIPALGMLDEELDGQAPIQLGYLKLVAWCLGVAFFGSVHLFDLPRPALTAERRVFLAAPLRRQVIVKEKLAFPSGSEETHLPSLCFMSSHMPPPAATARLIGLLHEASPDESNPSGLRSRFAAVPTDDSEELQIEEDQAAESEETIESMGPAGWRALGWSFTASASLTVSLRLDPLA